MKRILLLILIFTSSVYSFGRIKKLPSDSIALVTQMFSEDCTLPQVDTLFAYNKNEVWINGYVDCFAKIPLNKKQNLTLDLIEGSNMGCYYKIRLGAIFNNTPLVFHLRVPYGLKVYVNGLPAMGKMHKGYMTIKGRWRKGNEIMLQ